MMRQPNLSLLLGVGLISLSLGSMFALDLVRWSFILLMATSLTVIVTGTRIADYWRHQKQVGTSLLIHGGVANILMLLLLGVQSPQLIFRPYILGIGGMIVLYSMYPLLKSTKR